MWHIPQIRAQVLRNLLMISCFGIVLLLAPAAVRADAVEDLRRAIKLGTDASPISLDYRRTNLEKKTAQLRTLGDLRRALALEEWKEAANPAISQIHTDLRKSIGDRYKKALDDVIQNGNATMRLAEANAIAEMGPTVRATSKEDYGGFARGLTSEITQLAKDKDLAVRQEGLRALGNIYPIPQDAASVFESVLAQDSGMPKRIAADGLGQLIRVASFLQKQAGTTSGVIAGVSDVIDAIVAA
jgi:hypothetical protein